MVNLRGVGEELRESIKIFILTITYILVLAFLVVLSRLRH